MLRLLLLPAFALNTIAVPLKIVTIGDSLTDGYDEVSKLAEVPLLNFLLEGTVYPEPDFPNLDGNPRAFNWPELLSIFRSGEVDFGTEGDWGGIEEGFLGVPIPVGDLRFKGFQRNFALVGTTTLNWTSLLISDPVDDDFFPANLLYPDTKSALLSELATADVAVIFLGGNDLKNDYDQTFNTADASAFLDPIVSRLEDIHTAVRTAQANLPIVIATVPDVGATPNIYQVYNVPARQAATRAQIAAMNQTIINTFGAKSLTAVARVDRLTDLAFDLSPFHLNGTVFTMEGDPDNDPDHLFCKDNFHPATAAQALLANEIMAAINELIPGSMTPFTNREILESALLLNPDQPYLDWAAGYGLGTDSFDIDSDGDHLSNGVEMLINSSPLVANAPFTGSWRPGGTLGFTISSSASRYLDWIAEESADLSTWTEVPEARFNLSGEAAAVTPPTGSQSFFRLRSTPKP